MKTGKRKIFANCFTALSVLGAILLGISGSLLADQEHPTPYTGSIEFERIKALAGKWSGTTQSGGEAAQGASATYRVTSNGSAVVETIFEGSPHEMTSVYYEKDGKLMMTHYCAVGNRPTMALKKKDGAVLEFDYVSGENMEVSTDMHIHSLELEIGQDKNYLVQRWQGWDQGQPKQATVLELKRVG